VPEYCRIMRVQRDIPTTAREAGVDRTNLRQYVDRLLREKGIKCRCIRCREPKGKALDIKNLRIKALRYEASGGTEIFIAAEDPKKDILAGFCRLRIPNKPFREELTGRNTGKGAGKSTGNDAGISAGIRELHVYGEMAGIGEEGRVQHQGIGKRLLAEAERIAKQEFCRSRMVIISGIGAREYYRKLGYKKEGPYMINNI